MCDRETAWRDALSAHSSSGMSLKHYCRKQGLSYHQAVHWCRRLAVIAGDLPEAASAPGVPTFSLVELSPPPAPASWPPARTNRVDFRAWLEDVLTRLGATQQDDIDSLLPHNWTPAHA